MHEAFITEICERNSVGNLKDLSVVERVRKIIQLSSQEKQIDFIDADVKKKIEIEEEADMVDRLAMKKKSNSKPQEKHIVEDK